MHNRPSGCQTRTDPSLGDTTGTLTPHARAISPAGRSRRSQPDSFGLSACQSALLSISCRKAELAGAFSHSPPSRQRRPMFLRARLPVPVIEIRLPARRSGGTSVSPSAWARTLSARRTGIRQRPRALSRVPSAHCPRAGATRGAGHRFLGCFRDAELAAAAEARPDRPRHLCEAYHAEERVSRTACLAGRDRPACRRSLAGGGAAVTPACAARNEQPGSQSAPGFFYLPH